MTDGRLTFGELDSLDVDRLAGVGAKKRAALGSVGINTVLDMVMTYPRRWVDRTNEARISDLTTGEEALVLVSVRSVSRRTTRNRRTVVDMVVGDGSGRMHVVFFNQPWRQRQLQEGLTVALFGKADTYRGGLQMTNPVVDLIGDRTGRIVAIYPQSDKAQLTTWEFAGWVENALERCRPRGIADPVPADVLARHRLIGRQDALFGIHGPESMDQQRRCRRRLAFDELLRVQLALVRQKRAVELAGRGVRYVRANEAAPLVEQFHTTLPYELTGAQRQAFAEIAKDLEQPFPMHRLLQGDVGSGKTVVAVSALLAAVDGGHQGALMVPTEVLAEQHFTTIKALLADLSVPSEATLFPERPLRLELLTNRVTGVERAGVLAGLAAGDVDIVVGTHALIQVGVQFNSLGLAVVDEQHRFGVEQRAALRAKAGETVPDLLVMTATPIPRTAAMTVYGDLDVSVLDELPPGRTPIETLWANGPLQEGPVWDDVRAAVADGRQAYVVCPLIDESEKLQVASAEETLTRLSTGELQGLRLGLLHGRVPAAERESVMAAFRRRDIDVLVATTVIEVGVDVTNATVMVILDADRFGIAQLHQLRGRVGRAHHASRCWLVTAQAAEDNERLSALVASTDGFELAEVDLALRGEGTLMDTAQKGRSDLRLASLRRDRDLVEAARAAAFEMVGDDPGLVAQPLLRDEVDLLVAERQEYLTRS
ncbi:ATP-dependent DNA helicase RecG [soil metagenome]